MTLKPGFYSKEGSFFSASIEPCVTINNNKSHQTNNGASGDTVKAAKQELLKSNNKNQFITAYPNPFENQTTVEFLIEKESTVIIEVYNLLGVKVIQNIYTNTQRGLNKQAIDLSAYKDGIYIARIQSNDFSEALFLNKH